MCLYSSLTNRNEYNHITSKPATQGGTNITNYIQRAKPAKVQPHTARSD